MLTLLVAIIAITQVVGEVRAWWFNRAVKETLDGMMVGFKESLARAKMPGGVMVDLGVMEGAPHECSCESWQRVPGRTCAEGCHTYCTACGGWFSNKEG